MEISEFFEQELKSLGCLLHENKVVGPLDRRVQRVHLWTLPKAQTLPKETETKIISYLRENHLVYHLSQNALTLFYETGEKSLETFQYKIQKDNVRRNCIEQMTSDSKPAFWDDLIQTLKAKENQLPGIQSLINTLNRIFDVPLQNNTTQNIIRVLQTQDVVVKSVVHVNDSNPDAKQQIKQLPLQVKLPPIPKKKEDDFNLHKTLPNNNNNNNNEDDDDVVKDLVFDRNITPSGQNNEIESKNRTGLGNENDKPSFL